ncbi:MAG: protein-glutamate O-methyltransferase CheR [Gemmatimonadaceae bacterium]|nr:protein-glutamate O-methyltransferase CheR [Gemmatimonadaceae bacterium]NUQ93983.1 protein-glutamate O-methyltransferase CheR [Gemmatimonadaceae bacterium]NUR20559.1 protein-glutamate O-methyltransferase CheR [Gemmatimonadaceae bacterium]NUS98425.1 protein-glutamate O-methyltransferase CheR [Gemmatimonadaceae bacterium]
MSTEVEDRQFAELTAKIAREREFRCDSYKDKCLRRRIAVRMRARGVHTYSDYARVLDQDAIEWDKLMDALTINVTKLFRNWETYGVLADRIAPMLLAEVRDQVKVWSAGCSSGEESYSLATLFHRAGEKARTPVSPQRVRVLGTDIDRRSLEAAQRGLYPEEAFADTPKEYRDRYFTPGFPAGALPAIRALVGFERRDLLLESPPPGGHHMIVCRNVLIYFDRDTQEGLFNRFHDALLPGGILVLGKVETLIGGIRNKFAALDARERIYRKL